MEGRYQIMKKLWQRMIMLSVILVMVMTVHAFADNTIQYCASTFTFTKRGTQVSKQFTVASRTNITVHIKMYNDYSTITNSSVIQTINNNTIFSLQNVNNPSQLFYLTDKNFNALEYDVHMTVEAGTYVFQVQNNQDNWFNLYFRVTGNTGIDIIDNLELTVGSSQTVSIAQQYIYGGYMSVVRWDVSSYSPNPNAATVTNINNNVTPSKVTIYGREVGITYINVYGTDGSTDQIKVTVTAAPTKPTLLYSSLTLSTGEIVYNDVLNATANVTWTSSNTSVAGVTSTGKITANSTGTATVTATTVKNGTTYKLDCKVTVNRTDPDFIDFIIRISSFKPAKRLLKISITNLSDADMIVYSSGAKLQEYPGYDDVCKLKMKNASKVTVPEGKSKKITFTIQSNKVKGSKYDYGVQVKFKMEGRTYYARCIVDENLGQYILKENLATQNWLFSYMKAAG